MAWVTRPERPKGAKDEVKRPKEPPAKSRGPEGTYTSMFDNGDGDDDDHLDILFCVEILHIPVSMGSVKIIILDLLSKHCENTISDFLSPNENDDGSDLPPSHGSLRAC